MCICWTWKDSNLTCIAIILFQETFDVILALEKLWRSDMRFQTKPSRAPTISLSMLFSLDRLDSLERFWYKTTFRQIKLEKYYEYLYFRWILKTFCVWREIIISCHLMFNVKFYLIFIRYFWKNLIFH